MLNVRQSFGCPHFLYYTVTRHFRMLISTKSKKFSSPRFSFLETSSSVNIYVRPGRCLAAPLICEFPTSLPLISSYWYRIAIFLYMNINISSRTIVCLFFIFKYRGNWGNIKLTATNYFHFQVYQLCEALHLLFAV